MQITDSESGMTSVPRHILWKAARVNKEGEIDNENVQRVWEQCVSRVTFILFYIF